MKTSRAALPKPKDQKKKRKPYFEVKDCGRIIIDTSMPQGREMRDGITAEAWSRDNGICGICKKYVCLLEAVGDHIKPKGMGGAFRDDRVENIQPSHPECNLIKGSQRDFFLTP